MKRTLSFELIDLAGFLDAWDQVVTPPVIRHMAPPANLRGHGFERVPVLLRDETFCLVDVSL